MMEQGRLIPIDLPIFLKMGAVHCYLLVNHEQPALNELMDDLETGNASVERLQSLPIRKIYPGHGEPFTIDELPKPDLASH